MSTPLVQDAHHSLPSVLRAELSLLGALHTVCCTPVASPLRVRTSWASLCLAGIYLCRCRVVDKDRHKRIRNFTMDSASLPVPVSPLARVVRAALYSHCSITSLRCLLREGLLRIASFCLAGGGGGSRPFSDAPEPRPLRFKIGLREMFSTRLPASAVALLGLLLALASVVLHRGHRGMEISLSRLWNERGTAKASEGSAVGPTAVVGDADGRRVQQLGRSQRRELFGRGGGGGGDSERRRARLAFFIMSSGDDAAKLELLLPEIYDRDNVYLVHVDAKAPQDQVPLSTNMPPSNELVGDDNNNHERVFLVGVQ